MNRTNNNYDAAHEADMAALRKEQLAADCCDESPTDYWEDDFDEWECLYESGDDDE